MQQIILLLKKLLNLKFKLQCKFLDIFIKNLIMFRKKRKNNNLYEFLEENAEKDNLKDHGSRF